MSRCKKYLDLITITITAVLVIGLSNQNQNEFYHPRPSRPISFNSLEDLRESEQHGIDYLIDRLSEMPLPVDSSWTSLSYDESMESIFVRYDLPDSIRLLFIIDLRYGTFNEIKERRIVESQFTGITDVTEGIATLSTLDDFDVDSLHIGNGIDAFVFYNQLDEFSIREWHSYWSGNSWRASVLLNVDSVFVMAVVEFAPTKELALEILANVEFIRNGDWFDHAQ